MTDLMLLNRLHLPVSQRLELEELAYQHACVPESYDIAISDGQMLRSTCGRGVMSVIADGDFWHIAGGILAPAPLKLEMISWLRDISLSHGKTIAVYNVSQTDALRFLEEGFVVNKFGEEPILDLRDLNWSGGKFEWVRRQTNFCTRAGLEIEEVVNVNQLTSIAETLVEIMAEDLSDRTLDKPLRLLEGEFDPHSLLRRRLFLARNATGEIEAFLACSPLDSGRGWAFETYRQRKTATRGVIPFLFRAVIDELKKSGVEHVSLCLVPGRNVKDAMIQSGDWRIEKTLHLWYHHLDFLFNAKGQDHFKSRFRPNYVDRYLCVAPRNSLRSLWSFLKTTGTIHCNWTNLSRQLGRSLLRKSN